MKKEMIRIKGARENNLKNIDLEVPRNQFVVFTGLSGSGKSSLAFDTIYAEGQRRYMESLSSYARQFLGQMEKPDVDSIEGLSPAISIDQKSTNRNPRSTVGTVTEIYDYFRLLYARVGIPHCPKCGKPISKQTVDQMVDRLMQLEERTRIQLLAPIVRGRKGEHAKVFQNAKKSGYVRVRVDGNVYDLSEDIPMEKNKKHNIEIVVDRLVVKPGIEKRLTDSIETTLNLADGLMIVDVIGGETLNFSQSFSCPDCDISIDEVEPRSFSFNNPFGACPVCHGLGYKMEFDVDLIIPDQKLSIAEGAIQVFGWQSSTDKKSYTRAILDALAREYHFDLETPFKDYPQEVKDVLLYGTGGREVKVYYKGQRGEGVYDVAFEGIIKNVGRRYREASQNMKAEYETFMTITPCDECHGQRLKQESLAVTVADKNIAEMCDMSVGEMVSFLETMELSERQKLIGEQVLKEIKARIGFLNDVGLDYLTLSRATGTLSGGEAQRIRLATQIGSGLVGVAYILDEPSIGLHQRDNDKLIRTLKNLRDLGNTLIVVEHDEDTMLAADYIVDIGPKAGEYGGEVVATGTAKQIMKNKRSITGAYLSGKIKIPVPQVRRKPSGFLKVVGAQENNLKNIDVTREARKHDTIVNYVTKERLDQISETGKHQGVIAVSAAYDYARVEDILALAEKKGEPPFILILDGIEDPHNLGAIIRTANQAGAHGVIIPKRRAVGLTPTVARTSAGAVNYVPVAKVTNISNTMKELKDRGMWFVCADMDGTLMYDMDLTGPIGLVIGNEGDGVSPLVKKNCDMVASIPMKGDIDSLNASVAAGVLSYEIVRQRMKKG